MIVKASWPSEHGFITRWHNLPNNSLIEYNSQVYSRPCVNVLIKVVLRNANHCYWQGTEQGLWLNWLITCLVCSLMVNRPPISLLSIGSFYSHHLHDQHPHNVRQHNVNEIYSNFVNTFIGLADILGPSGTIKDQLSISHSLQLNKNQSIVYRTRCVI